jgi:NADPH:quinone reductase-like Zn-dependent oxidoreductase
MKGLVDRDGRFVLTDDLEMPVVKSGHALVRVVCASVNPTDLDIMEGKYDLWLKLLRYKHPVKSGLEFSGVVEADSERFKKEDKVFGYVDFMNGPKSHQEYLAVNEDYMALMPSGLSFEQAAALPLGALTSLVALEDKGNIHRNSEVLINGASGGLGVYAVQIGKIFGARITAVAGQGQEDYLTGLGADRVIDYNQTDITAQEGSFDLILDLTTDLRFKSIKHLLSKGGRFIPADPMKNAADFLNNMMGSRKTGYLFVQYGNHEKLSRIAKWVEEGSLRPQVDSSFSLPEFSTAFERVLEKGRRGRVVIGIAE